MPIAFFQIPLSVKPKSGGAAEIIAPEVFQGLNYAFVIVKEGAEEGIVRVDVSETDLEKITGDSNYTKLESESMKALYESYPKPKLKQQYKMTPPTSPPPQVAGEEMKPSTSPPPQAVGEQFETDEQGNPIVMTLQTVRSGFYLIDVPVVEP